MLLIKFFAIIGAAVVFALLGAGLMRIASRNEQADEEVMRRKGKLDA